MTEKRRIDVISIGLYTLLTAVLLFMIAPLVFVIINSFNASSFSPWPPTGFSLAWYREVLDYEPFRRGFRNSIVTALGTTVIALVLGSMVAYALSRYRFRGRGLVQAIFFSPLIVPRVAIGLMMFVLYISMYSSLFGTTRGVMLAHTLLVLPFVITIFAANISGINPVLEEAAQDLGANPVQTFIKITLPQMRVGFIIAGLFAFITSFDEVEAAIFLVRPASNTLPIEMFLYLEQRQTPALAALSSILIVLTLAVVFIALAVLRGHDLRRYAGRGG
ncbi:MAG: putative spermidine/putrescine transport system permease protein [Thermomicrobiales bacterium]|jgi:putative spermidine/putrescine transport system permease protein|nr:putative spermidine/putrescine transport system permease protein [Thermomicrobiales bacterium]